MRKTKTVEFDGVKFTINTVVETEARTLRLEGEPMIAVYDQFIQIGCMRISKVVMAALVEYVDSLPDGTIADGLVIQPGTYKTKDPNCQ